MIEIAEIHVMIYTIKIDNIKYYAINKKYSELLSVTPPTQLFLAHKTIVFMPNKLIFIMRPLNGSSLAMLLYFGS